MTKRELVVMISKETGIIQEDVYTVVQKTLDHVTDALVQGETIEFRDFGVFEICTRKSRVGRNPNRPQDVVRIPERRVVKFKPGKKMKQRVLEGPEPAPAAESSPEAREPDTRIEDIPGFSAV